MTEAEKSSAILFWLHQAHHGMRLRITREFKRAGYPITAEQWSVLADLWQYEDSQQSLIAERTGRDAPAITRLVRSLEEDGYVERKAIDRRTNIVRLTKEGKNLHRLLQPIFSEIIASSLAGFSVEEIALGTKIMKSIAVPSMS